MSRFFKTVAYVLTVHVLALAAFTIFRLIEFITLGGMIADKEAGVLTAFVKGLWFDNVIACYVGVLPVTVLLVTAAFGLCRRWLLRGANVWYGVLFGVAFMPSAANTHHFQYFFPNFNSSIFAWAGRSSTTHGSLLPAKSRC